jgi:hypothetical protein
METSESIEFLHYKKLPKSIKILATQTSVRDFMFKHNLKTYAQLKKHIKHQFKESDAVLKSVEYNFWRRKLKGEVLNKSNGFKLFPIVMNKSTKLLNHPFWSLLATRTFDAPAIDGLMKRLPYIIRRIIRSSGNKTKSYPLKQSYAPQKQRLYEEESLDSLTALLLISIIDIKRYKKQRCCQAEQLAFNQFFHIFTNQYPIKSRDDLAIEIDKLLCRVTNEFHIPFIDYKNEDGFAEAKSIDPIYFGTLYSKNIANGMFKIIESTT